MLVYTTLASRLAAARIPVGIQKYTGKKFDSNSVLEVTKFKLIEIVLREQVQFCCW